MKFLIFFEIIFTLCDSQDTQNIVSFMELAIRKLSSNADFALGSEWRDHAGNLRSGRVIKRSLSAPSIQECSNVDGTETSGALTYQYGYDLSSHHLCLYIEGDFGYVDMNYDAEKRVLFPNTFPSFFSRNVHA